MTREEQQAQALAAANEARHAKAELKRDLAGMRQADALLHLAALIDAGDPIVLGCRLVEALQACDHIGPSAVGQFVRHVGAVSGDRRVRELSVRQRGLLVLALRSPRSRGGFRDTRMGRAA